MSIISAETMKTTDDRELQNKQRQKGARGTEPKVKGWELNDFAVQFKLGFLQLICKASLILSRI